MGKGYQLINKTDRSLLLSFKCNLSHLTLQNVNISVPLEISWQLGTENVTDTVLNRNVLIMLYYKFLKINIQNLCGISCGG